MANAVLHLLAEHFVLVMAFFMGLVLASCWMLRRETGRWDLVNVLLFVAGFAVTTGSFLLNPAIGSSSLLYMFVCGMIAICAMILPGISGAFILILLGAYEQVLNALRSMQMDVVLVFALGCAIGLLSFAHLLAWLFDYYRQRTYAFLVGMLAASLIVLWPWRQLQESGRGVPVWPEQYLALTGEPSRVLMAFFCAALGAVVIVTFAQLSRREHSA
jgi:putative membrane protein